ncbi:HisA/HisF-related TIM barrel protein [Streptomyces hesseae]|uniref:HisA/HisF-related TIM barrel protein n=1 Tax=Streptomyces hesseae TaxID=3075519 RepID=A0ABU2SJU1_9ACTN|nr:HisA/HisF-related TIM barrel protein [Streptomyces sp. DSM 40473]MDT0449244.1 HisA/HisF-related TIM barrel protein [Streptomyces sp. DSM 40473]
MFTIFPSVHVAAGQVVHLVEDGYVPEPARTDPVGCARAFQDEGAQWLHLVMTEEADGFDVDAAERVVRAVDLKVQMMCRAGIHDDASLQRALDTGCARLNLGRGALEDLAWCAQAIARHGQRLGVSLPVRIRDDGYRVVGLRGADLGGLWNILAALDHAGCSRYVITDVSKEGALKGPNLRLFEDVCAHTPAAVLAAGGITTLSDLKAVADLRHQGVEGALIGRALYAGTFSLPEALAAITVPARTAQAATASPGERSSLPGVGGP